MSSTAIATVITMMKSLSEDKQNELVEHLREYIQDLPKEPKWQNSFNKSQDKSARQQIADGKPTKDFKKSNSSFKIYNILNDFVLDKNTGFVVKGGKSNKSLFLNPWFRNRWFILSFCFLVFAITSILIIFYFYQPSFETNPIAKLLLILSAILMVAIYCYLFINIYKLYKEIKTTGVQPTRIFNPEVYQKVVHKLSGNFDEEELYKEEIRFEIALRETKRRSNLMKNCSPLISIFIVAYGIFIFGKPEHEEQINLLYGTVARVSGIVFLSRAIFDILLELLDKVIKNYETCISILQKARLIAKEKKPVKKPLKRGSAKGKVWMSEDFDKPLSDFNEYM